MDVAREVLANIGKHMKPVVEWCRGVSPGANKSPTSCAIWLAEAAAIGGGLIALGLVMMFFVGLAIGFIVAALGLLQFWVAFRIAASRFKGITWQ